MGKLSELKEFKLADTLYSVNDDYAKFKDCICLGRNCPPGNRDYQIVLGTPENHLRFNADGTIYHNDKLIEL